MDSTNLKTARTSGPSIPSSSSHNTLKVLAEAAEGFELPLLTRSLQQLSCKVSCIEAANRQELQAPKNNLGKHAIRVLKIASAPPWEGWQDPGDLIQSRKHSSDALFFV